MADLALGAGLGHGASGVEVIKGNDFGLDELLLKVGVDYPRSLRSSRTLLDGPSAGFLRTSSQVGLQAERCKTCLSQSCQARLGLADGLEELHRFVLVELKQLGLSLGIKEHALCWGNELGELGLLRVVGKHCFIRVEDVQERLRSHQVQLTHESEVDFAVLGSSEQGTVIL